MESPYLLKHFGFINSNSGVDIIMEYCENGTLEDLIKKEKKLTI